MQVFWPEWLEQIARSADAVCIGHGIESYFLDNPNKENLTHGEAIAIGMVCEAYVSNKELGFDLDKVNEIKRRQKFRPFAPMILEERAHEYFHRKY